MFFSIYLVDPSLTLRKQFVEDEGDIVFYKNAHGHAAARPLVIDANASDSGIDVHEKDN